MMCEIQMHLSLAKQSQSIAQRNYNVHVLNLDIPSNIFSVTFADDQSQLL
jgi:hypothetical protein